MADKSRNGRYDIVMQAEKIVEDYEKKYFVHSEEKKKTVHKDSVMVTVMLGAVALFVVAVVSVILVF